jgi:hypothetical protein
MNDMHDVYFKKEFTQKPTICIKIGNEMPKCIDCIASRKLISRADYSTVRWTRATAVRLCITGNEGFISFVVRY